MVLPSVRNALARKVVRLVHASGGEAVAQRRAGRARLASFEVRFRPDAALSELLGRGAFVPERACDRKAMLRGFFMASGSVSAPGSDYHLELVLPGEEWGAALLQALSGFAVEARPGRRAGRARLYLKEADGIARFLSLAGASRGVLEFERARVVREMAGGVNRRLNFETANIAKTIGAAQAQIAAIRRLEGQGRLDSLSPALKQAASARRIHPQASLDDLAHRLGLTRSAANHRLRRLVELAQRGAKP